MSPKMKEHMSKVLGSPGLKQATEDLNLNEQERFLYQLHLKNRKNPVYNEDGSISTLRQSTVDIDGRTYSIPTIWDGEELNLEDAMKRVREIGLDSFPSYKSPEEAQTRYNLMRQYFELD